MTSATKTSVGVWLASSTVGLVASIALMAVGDIATWRAGWLGQRLLVVTVIWLYISTTLAFPVILLVLAVLHRGGRSRRQLLGIAVVVTVVSTLFAWYLASTVSGSWESVAVLVGIGTLIGYGVVLGRLDLSTQHRIGHWLAPGVAAAVYLAFWLSTAVAGNRSVRMHEVAHWKETVPIGYWGHQEPTEFVSQMPLGGLQARGNRVVGVSGGFVGFPFAVLIDFNVVGLNTGLGGRAFYLWFPGYAQRLWGTPLSVRD